MTQVTFSVEASEDDGRVLSSDTMYPPLATPIAAVDSGIDGPYKIFYVGPNLYEIRVFLMRWDTSTLPDDAEILAATLRVHISNTIDTDSRSLTAEWYEAGTIGEEDWTSTVGTSAHSGIPLSGIPDGPDYDLALQNPSNINLSGYTGLRLHISGADPTGQNVVGIVTWDDTLNTGPRLIVEYVAPDSPDNNAPIIAGRGAV